MDFSFDNYTDIHHYLSHISPQNLVFLKDWVNRFFPSCSLFTELNDQDFMKNDPNFFQICIFSPCNYFTTYPSLIKFDIHSPSFFENYSYPLFLISQILELISIPSVFDPLENHSILNFLILFSIQKLTVCNYELSHNPLKQQQQQQQQGRNFVNFPGFQFESDFSFYHLNQLLYLLQVCHRLIKFLKQISDIFFPQTN